VLQIYNGNIEAVSFVIEPEKCTLGSNDASSELTYLVNDGMLELVIIAHFSGSITKETASILPL
jgi:hypothetical protein